jgi:hypothetical protein
VRFAATGKLACVVCAEPIAGVDTEINLVFAATGDMNEA